MQRRMQITEDYWTLQTGTPALLQKNEWQRKRSEQILAVLAKQAIIWPNKVSTEKTIEWVKTRQICERQCRLIFDKILPSY